MWKGKRVVIVTPAGRRAYLSLLLPQVLGLMPFVDEYRLWLNTTNGADIEFIEQAARDNPGKVFVDRLPPGVSPRGSDTIHHFFVNCVETDCVYIRVDDDVVLLDDKAAFINFLDYRISRPDLLLVFATILNNAVVTHLLQRRQALPTTNGIAGYQCMDSVGWRDGNFARCVHEAVLGELERTNSLEAFRSADTWHLMHDERVSINAISWLGEAFATFKGKVDMQEEEWLCQRCPSLTGKKNAIFGGFCVVHYAFYTQRPYLDTTDILDRYSRIVARTSGNEPGVKNS